MYLYANALGADRRENPRDDIVSKLIHGEVDGERLSEIDFDLFFLLLSVAGNETTRNALSHGMAALLENPEAVPGAGRRPVDHRGDGGRRGAALRLARDVLPPQRHRGHGVQGPPHRRRATRSACGSSRPTATRTCSTTRTRFDIHRSPNPHVAFGGGGPHHCIGTHLARMEMKVLFEELVARAPRIEKLGEPTRLRSNFINGLKHLPVRLVPAKEPPAVL